MDLIAHGCMHHIEFIYSTLLLLLLILSSTLIELSLLELACNEIKFHTNTCVILIAHRQENRPHFCHKYVVCC